MNESTPLISPVFPFHFELPLRHTPARWGKAGVELPAEYQMPSFNHLLHDGPQFADLRMGWNDGGLFVDLAVHGKKFTPWCRPSRPEESDGVHIYLGLRETQTLRRANRYCHQFVCMPADQPSGSTGPRLLAVPIARAQEHPTEIAAGTLQIVARLTPDGYRLRSWIPATALSDFRPQEFPYLGFTYVVMDRELGWQTFSLGAEYPLSDPSLWGRLTLAPPAKSARS